MLFTLEFKDTKSGYTMLVTHQESNSLTEAAKIAEEIAKSETERVGYSIIATGVKLEN